MISCAAQLLKARREAIKNKRRATGEVDVLFYFYSFTSPDLTGIYAFSPAANAS